MTYKEIFEELKDLDKETDFVHYTSLPKLYQILKIGKIKGFVYDISLKNGKEEICVMRKSTDSTVKNNKDKIESLSQDADGGIKIYLYSHRIIAGVRNAKIAPISEFSREDILILNLLLKRIQSACSNISIKGVRIKLDKFSEKISNLTRKNTIEEELFIKNFCKENIKNSQANNLRYIKRDIKKYLETKNRLSLNAGKLNREGEERLSFPKGGGIPVDPMFIKIRIRGDVLTDKNNFKNINFGSEAAKHMLSLIKKYNTVFVKDLKFNELIENLKQESELR